MNFIKNSFKLTGILKDGDFHHPNSRVKQEVMKLPEKGTLFVATDFHANYEDFLQWMDKTELNKNKKGSVGLILGDVADNKFNRPGFPNGDGDIKIYDEIRKRSNLFLLEGDHEYLAYSIFDMKKNNPSRFAKISKQDLLQSNILERMNEDLSDYLKAAPKMAYTQSGIVFTHAGPLVFSKDGAPTVIFGRPKFLDDHVEHDGKMMTTNPHPYSKEQVDNFLDASSKSILVSGHTPIKHLAYSEESEFENGVAIYGNQAILATSFGALNDKGTNEYKRYLEIDLKEKYISPKDLANRCSRKLY